MKPVIRAKRPKNVRHRWQDGPYDASPENQQRQWNAQAAASREAHRPAYKAPKPLSAGGIVVHFERIYNVRPKSVRVKHRLAGWITYKVDERRRRLVPASGPYITFDTRLGRAAGEWDAVEWERVA